MPRVYGQPKRSPRQASTPVGGSLLPASGYRALSMRPLTILVFLSPLLLFYELGTLLFLSSGTHVEVVRARVLLSTLFNAAGPLSFHLPPLLLGIILLAWHALDKQKARLEGRVLVGMAAESFLWTLPLLVLGVIAGTAPLLATDGPAAGLAVQGLSTPARLTLALGAGLYEELLFRLLLITVIHALLFDGFRLPDSTGAVVAVVASAVAFTFYHNVRLETGGMDTRLLLMYGVAGLYLGALFFVRGFGIVVAVHALYDIFALVILPQPVAGQAGA